MRHLELHILQSVPVACLNRDDLGSPKTAIFGGVQRARVSSQCWKRAARELAQELLPSRFQGQRTRLIVEPLRDALVKHNQAEADALENARGLADALATLDDDAVKKGKQQVKVLFFTTRKEIDSIAASFIQTGEIKKAIKSYGKDAGKDVCMDAADIAFFGRMVASAPELGLEGAAMFSHALSTHKVDNEIDFFSALDDWQREEETGAGMAGTLEFNAATYYRFVAINLDLLADNAHLGQLTPDERRDITGVFVEAALKALPAARQNSMNASTLPAYVLCVLRTEGHPVQLVNAFEEAVWSPHGRGYLRESIERMEKEYDGLEATWGIHAAACLRMPETGLEGLLQGVREHVI